MSIEDNKAHVRRYLEEAWNKGNVGIIDEVMASDYARLEFTRFDGDPK